jgi:magnesium chelatase subunit D
MQIAEICASFEVDGMRADIVTARTAVAHAAWSGRDEVTTEDIRVAARLALPHRRRRNPFDAPGISEEQLEQALQDAQPDEPAPEGPDDDGPGSGSEAPSADAQPGEGNGDGSRQDDENTRKDGQNGSGNRTVGAGKPYRARLFTVKGTGEGAHGRRSRAITDTGRTVGVQPPSVREGKPHLVATLRAAAPHQRARSRTGTGLEFRPQDLRFALREGREGNLVLFCVDASGSMGARARMREVKSAVLSLLVDAYQRRDKVGLITFRAGGAELALPPTTSVDAAASRLESLPTGGRTPLAEGLLEAVRVLRVEAIRDPRRRPLLVVVTDGRATSGTDAVVRSQAAAGLLAAGGISAVVMDCESGRMRLGLAAELAERLGAEHVPLGEVAAETLAGAVRSRTSGRAA